jgi:hypothetical protein
MLLPKAYFDAIDELTERIGMTVKEWINYATIKENNALSGLSNHYLYSPVTNAFLSKYNIGQLKDSTIQHIVKRYTNFSMEEVELKNRDVFIIVCRHHQLFFLLIRKRFKLH